jgi:hypothetical protein
VGHDGFLCGGDYCKEPITAQHCADFHFDCYLRGAVSAGSYAVAGRLPADHGRALLVGRVFSLWNMLAYAVGIGIGMALDRFTISPHSAS